MDLTEESKSLNAEVCSLVSDKKQTDELVKSCFSEAGRKQSGASWLLRSTLQRRHPTQSRRGAGFHPNIWTKFASWSKLVKCSCPSWPSSWRKWSAAASVAPPFTSSSSSAAQPSSSRCCSSSSSPPTCTNGSASPAGLPWICSTLQPSPSSSSSPPSPSLLRTAARLWREQLWRLVSWPHWRSWSTPSCLLRPMGFL